MRFESLVSYVPALLARQLAARGPGGLAPEARRFATAVLCADISGFTALTERLAERGPAAAETLLNILNACFQEIVSLITSHGGEVVKFAGDCVIAVWPPPAAHEDARSVARCAAQCARAIQETLGTRPAVEDGRLHVRIGVGAGPLWAGIVGGTDDRWEFLVAGDPLARAARAASRAEPDETVVTGTAWPSLAEFCLGRALASGDVQLGGIRDALTPPPLPPPLAAAPSLRAFIPPAVVARIDAGQTDWLAEFRRVTAMFVNLGELDYEAPDVLERLGALLRAIQEGVGRHDGDILQLVADDKGTTVVTAWGVPAHTHEDDARRAVAAALDLHTALGRRGCAAAFGVATGRAFCGDRGGPVRREYAMLGAVVNLAARLMQAAGNDVLCDAATARAAGTDQAFTAVTGLRLKGIADPVTAFRPGASPGGTAPRAAAAETSLFGRTTERARLRERLSALRERARGGVLVVEGEPGIGKSSLLADLGTQARALDLATVAGAAEAVEQATPYFVWREVLATLFWARELGDGSTALQQRVLSRLRDSPTLASWAPLLNGVLPLDLPDTEVSAQMTGASRADALRELIVYLLRDAAAREPLVITLDDGHWFDSSSWAVAAAVARRAPSVLLVVATRPLADPVPPEYAGLLAAPGCEQLALEPLSAAAVLELVRERLGVTALSEDVAAFIRDRAEGNPFFSEQLAYALRDDGHLVIEGGRCRVARHTADLRALDVPATVQGVVTGRIDRLNPLHQLALKVASVIGRSFPYRILSDVYPVAADRPALPRSLARLSELALILVEAPEPELAYLFRHVITQEVAYDLLSFAQRHELHAAVARWHETHHAADLTPYLQLLAHHWARADNPPAAIGYLERAAEHALAHYANAEAIRFLGEAIELDRRSNGAGDRVRRARWQWWLGRAHLQLSDNRASREHLLRSLAMLGRPVPRIGWGMALSTAAQLARQLAHRILPARRSRSDEERAVLLQAADIHHELSEIAYFGNELGLLLHTTVHTLNLAEATGVDGQLARAYATAAVATGSGGLHRLARFYCRRSMEHGARTSDLPARAFSQLACGAYYIGIGDWPRLDDLLVRTAELFERLGDRYRWELTLTQRAYTLMYRGRFAAGREVLERACASAGQDGALQVLLLSVAGLVTADLAQDRVDAARLEQLEALLARNAQRSEAVLGNGLLALARLRQGDAAAAERAAATATPLIARLPPPSFYTMRSVAGVAELALALWEAARDQKSGERKTLRRRAGAACRAVRRFALIYPIGRPRAWLCRGRYHLLSGDRRAAARAWLRCITEADRLDMPYEAGLAYLALAQASGDSAPVAPYATRAAAILDDLGVVYDVPRPRQRATGA